MQGYDRLCVRVTLEVARLDSEAKQARPGDTSKLGFEAQPRGFSSCMQKKHQPKTNTELAALGGFDHPVHATKQPAVGSCRHGSRYLRDLKTAHTRACSAWQVMPSCKHACISFIHAWGALHDVITSVPIQICP